MTSNTQQLCHPERRRGTLRSSASATAQVVAIVVLIAVLLSCGPPRDSRIVIGTKNFTEQLVLGELFAQQIENKSHLKVERRFYLAGTYICHQSIFGRTHRHLSRIHGHSSNRNPETTTKRNKRRGLQRNQIRICETFQPGHRPTARLQRHLRHANPRRRRAQAEH